MGWAVLVLARSGERAYLCGLTEGGPHRFTVTVATDPAVGTFSQVVLRHEICHAFQVRTGIGGDPAVNPHPAELAGICPYWSGPALLRGLTETIGGEPGPCSDRALHTVVLQDGQGGWAILDVAAFDDSALRPPSGTP